MLKIANVMNDHNPVNIMTKKAWKISPVISATFDNKKTVEEILIKLKNEDLGVSIVIEGLIDEIRDLGNRLGLSLNSAHISLGTFGKKDRLPSEKVLEITTMCGYHCISPQSVLYYAHLIKNQKISIQKAAERLAKPCVCGIFNTERAVQILKELV